MVKNNNMLNNNDSIKFLIISNNLFKKSTNLQMYKVFCEG